jgi:hypothetical protein
MNPNSNVMGKSESTQEEQDNVNVVCSSLPLFGDTEKRPGNGGPLVVTTMEAND